MAHEQLHVGGSMSRVEALLNRSRRRPVVAVLAAALVSLAFVAAASAAHEGAGPPSIAAGPAFGFVPSHNANHQPGQGHVSLLVNHGGPVMSVPTQVGAIFWGSGWSNPGDKI